MFDAELRVGIGGPPAVGELMLSDLWVGLEGERFFPVVEISATTRRPDRKPPL